MAVTPVPAIGDVSSVPRVAVTAAGRPAPYFINAVADAAFVGGLSIAAFALVHQWGASIPRDRAYELLLLLVWLVNYPHFSATLQRLYRTRQNAAQYPLTAYGLPLIIGAGTVASLAWPHAFAPYFVKLMLLWSSYHFSGQSLGISLIYARRHGVTLSRNERRVLALFIFSTYLTFMLRIGILGGSYYGIDYPTLAVPAWLPQCARWATWAAGGFLIAWVASWSWRQGRMFPLIVLLPAVTQYVWFVLGPATPTFFIFVPLFHSLQYLPIALAMQLGDRIPNAAARSQRVCGVEIARWCVLNLAGGTALFLLLPAVVAWCGVELPVATGVIFAAIQLHHFVVDGVIWKLRNAGATSPLMQSLSVYAGSRS